MIRASEDHLVALASNSHHIEPELTSRFHEMGRLGLIVLIVLYSMLWVAPAADARIYKFRKDGVWCYTDTPSEPLPGDSQEMAESRPALSGPPSNAAVLLADHPARNDIERASAACVTVKSALGLGSGFFISDQGHIITNKHVIRSTQAQESQHQSQFDQADSRLHTYENALADEKRRLDSFKSRLDQLKADAEAETHPQRKQVYKQDYEQNQRAYLKWKGEHDQRCKAFETDRQKLDAGRRSHDYRKSVADLSSHFTIILADKTELYVHLLSASTTHDLALLKLEGYRTPRLKSASTAQLTQGTPVYAIGNPARLQNSVTSGVFSGFEQGYIQTNAQIYPGNSGGPLITSDGRVVGINSFKQLTRQFEGLGFAIPIETALTEFAEYLPAP